MQRVLSFLLFVVLAISLIHCGSSSKGNSGSNTAGGSGTGSGGSGSGGSGGGTSGGSGGSGGSGSGGSGGSGSVTSSAVAYAYTSNGASIHAYAVNGDGSLTTVSGSPFSVSTQVTSPQGALVTNGANLYAIATGGTNLAIMPLNKSNGALSQPNTVSALATDPNTGDMAASLSLDTTGQSLYVEVGLSDLDSGINVFSVGSSNTATHTQFLSASAITQSALVFTANNQVAYTNACAARLLGVFAYSRSSNGNLTPLSIPQPNPPVTAAGTGYCPIGVAGSATGRVAIAWTPFQYISSATVGNQIYVGIYNVNSDNSLTLVPNSGVTTASLSTSTLALNFDPTGAFLAVAGNGGVQTYTLTSGGTLTSSSSPQQVGVSFTSVAWDKSNHVFATSSNALYVWNAKGGILSSAAGSPYPGGTGLAVLPLQ